MTPQQPISAALIDCIDPKDGPLEAHGSMRLTDYFDHIYQNMTDNERSRYEAQVEECKNHILQYPMFTEDEVIDRLRYSPEAFCAKLDSGDCDDLIYLPTDDGRMFPQFQFSEHDVKPVVRMINVFMGARTDPWGVAGWWLYEHGRLGFPPHELLNGERIPKSYKRSSWVDILVALAENVRYDCSF